MKTRQGTGYTQRAAVLLMLCATAVLITASAAFAFTAPNNINACFDCHGSPVIPGGNDARPVDGAYRNITTGSVVGNHRTHITSAVTTTSQALTACAPCHAPVVNSLSHRNGVINMRMHINSSAVNVRGYYNKPAGSPAAFFNQTSVPILSTCNNVNCHFRKITGPWGSTTFSGQTEANCAYCHNSSGASTMTTGNHTKHITMLGNTITTCANCHVNRTTFSHATTAKAGGTIAVAMTNTPLAGAPVYNAGTHATYPNYFGTTGYGNCNNVYCHSSAQAASGSGAGTYQAVTWNSAALTCSGCHGSTTANLNTGTHSKHLNGYGYLCSDCHGTGYDASTNSVVAATHVNKLINVNLTNKGQGNVPTYGGDTTPQNAVFGVNATCNNTVCHGKSSGAWGASVSDRLCTECHGQPNVAYANFSSAIIAPGGLGVDTGGNTLATAPRVGTHQTHLLAATSISGTMHCGECHTTHVAINELPHLNYTTSTVSIKGPLGTAYSKVPTVARVSGLVNCSNVACHVGKRPVGTAAGQSGMATYPVPVWNNAALLGGTSVADTCNAKCHNMPPGGGVPTDTHSSLAASGSYTTFGGIATACGGCHGAVLNIANNPGTYAGVFSDKSRHIDGTVDANGHAFPYPGSLHFNDTGATSPFGGCSGCHNVATSGGPYAYPSAAGAAPACMGCHTTALNQSGTTTSCQDCHGTVASNGRPTGNTFPNYSGAHTTHAVTKGYTCAQCHANGGSGSPNHGPSNRINSTNVTFVHVSSIPTQYPFHWSGNATTGNCTNAYCHSSGQSANGASATPVYAAAVTWNGTAACGSCHSISTFATGSHTKHLAGLATNFNRNALCADCHTGATETAYNSALHVNKLIDVGNGSYSLGGAPGNGYGNCTTSLCHSNGAAAPTYKTATWGTPNAAGCNFCHDAIPTTLSHTIHIGGGANYSYGCAECHGHNGTGSAHNDGIINVIGSIGYNGSKQCTTSDCHSNGKAVGFAYTTSPAWGGTFTGDRCAACHGNWPTSDAHLAHVVGLHNDDIYNMTGGKIAASATVASATNAGHGNPLYSTTISCNICHYTVVTVNYNDNSPSCNTAGTCHASGGSGALKGSLTTASVSKTLHVNRVRNVSFAPVTIRSKAQVFTNMTGATNYNAYWTRTNGYKTGASSHDASIATLQARAGYASGTCSTVACHSGVTVNWTDGAITCDKCHTAP